MSSADIRKSEIEYDIEETKTPLYFIPSYVDGYIKGLEENFNSGINWHLMEFRNKIGRFVVKADELNNAGLNLIKYFQKPGSRQRVKSNFDRLEKEWNRIFKKMDSCVSLSNREIFAVYKDSYDRFYEMLSWTLISEPLDYVLDIILPKKTGIKYLSDLTASSRPSFIKEEEDELLRSKNIKNHAQKFFWIHGSHWETKRLSLSYFQKRKDELIKIKPQKHNSKNIMARRKLILDQIKADKETRFLVSLNDFSSILHDRRKAWFLKSVYYYEKLLKEIGRRNNYKLDEMKWFMPDEIMALESGEKVSKEVLKSREKFSILISSQEHKLYIGKQAKEIATELFPDKTENGYDHVKGIPASRGLAKGTAKVLATPQDGNFNKGDVLITSMTRPDFVPLMKLASAVVTDEGGLTCHAAIISRELHIPCVIGTKNATRIFHSGDIILVDANKGTVKILGKNSGTD